jgi:hypothetical protein
MSRRRSPGAAQRAAHARKKASTIACGAPARDAPWEISIEPPPLRLLAPFFAGARATNEAFRQAVGRFNVFITCSTSSW